MKFRKILVMLLILVTLGFTLNAVVASNPDPIKLGDIKNDDLVITELGQDKLDFEYSVEVDISELSSEDKKLFEKSLDNNNTSFILNLTSSTPTKIAITMHSLPKKAEIVGNTLYIKNNNMFRLINGIQLDNLRISAVSFNTTSGQLFIAEK